LTVPPPACPPPPARYHYNMFMDIKGQGAAGAAESEQQKGMEQ
jgi:hypothetical protein